MKILNKLTLKNLKMNKSRTIVTIIGIMLSAALITVVAGMAASGQQTMINAEIHISGDYDLSVSRVVNKNNIETIKNNRYVKNVYVQDSLGCADLPKPKNKYKPYITVTALSSGALGNCFDTTLQEGRYPQNSSELVLSQDVIESSDKKFSVGDTITLEIGDRTDENGTNYYTHSPYSVSNDKMIKAEEFIDVKQSRTYKIVGILNDCASRDIMTDSESACSSAFTIADVNNLSDKADLYIDLLPEGEKNYVKFTSEITGLTEDEAGAYFSGNWPEDEDDNEAFSSKSRFGIINLNYSLLNYKGYGLSYPALTMLYWLASIIIVIIIIASVFVIRNSFAISITEKTRLYGMLASVGATSKQIRRNVLFEGFMLGVIAIPLGLLLGIGVMILLVLILNILLSESLNGIKILYSIPVWVLLFAAALAGVTILLSTLSSALRASRIAPVTAIRGNRDIKTGKKYKKLKSPKLLKKIFGVGGDIAYKNLKRSKKKYRTTVISIIVSVTLFIAIASFIDYGNKYTKEYYSGMDFNIVVSNNNGFGTDADTLQNELYQISNLDGIKSASIEAAAFYYFEIDKKLITDEAIDDDTLFRYSPNHGKKGIYLDIIGVDDNVYKDVVKSLGYEYENVKNKGILYNQYSYYVDDEKKTVKLFNVRDGEVFSGASSDTDDDISYQKINIEIAGCVYSTPKQLENSRLLAGKALIVSNDWFKNNISISNSNYLMCINAENPDEVEQKINDSGYFDLKVDNYDKYARQYNALTLVISIFIYGFIIVISLIGVTNIFNTITTNMKLRSKEFAMLKSIGMTKKEFDRMIRLESLFYGTKSLIIGIPLGLLGGYAIYCAFDTNKNYDYIFPWLAVLISIVFVFVMVWLIMKFSIAKVGRQNIIETIRNDNI